MEETRKAQLDDGVKTEAETPPPDPSLDIIARVLRWRAESDPIHGAWLKDMEEDFQFYEGDQWEQKDKDKLQEEGRPALSFNRIKPQIDLATGVQEEQKIDIKVIGRTKEDTPVADGLSQLIKYVCDQNDFEMRQGDFFQDGVICGRGWISVDQDFDDDWIDGKTLIRTVDPNEIRIPKNRERDLSDCDYILRVKSFSRDKVKQLWPEAAEKLTTAFHVGDAAAGGSTTPPTTSAFPDYGKASDAKTVATGGFPAPDSVEVIEAQWKEWKQRKFLLDMATRDIKPVENEAAAIEALAIPTLRILTKRVPEIHFARVCSGILLESGPIPHEDSFYSLVPFFAYRGRKKDYGIVKNLKDPQREANKRRSQMLHIINTSANAGWITDDEDLGEQLEEKSSTPGFVAIAVAGKKWERVQPPAMPVGILRMEEEAKDDMKAISGINADLLGMREATQSGIAIDLRMRQGLTIIGRVFSNFRYALKQVTRLVISRIVQYMPVEEMARILGPEVQPEVIARIKSKDVLKYDVVIAQSPSTPSIRISNFIMMMDLRKSNVPIPDEILIEISDLPQKDKIIEHIRRVQGTPAPGAKLPGLPGLPGGPGGPAPGLPIIPPAPAAPPPAPGPA
jgi:hypothetical protein